MLYQEDLAEALYRHDVRDIETAFRALVGDPEAGDVEAPDTALLVACCRGLADDDAPMPPGAVDAVNDATRPDPGEALPHGATYAAGAARVWREIQRFAPLFGEAIDG